MAIKKARGIGVNPPGEVRRLDAYRNYATSLILKAL